MYRNKKKFLLYIAASILLFVVIVPAQGQHPHNYYARIVVDERGVYRLTHEYLEGTGLDIDEIDPSGINVVNKGECVPIFIKGENDGTFDPGDYIEFRGTFHPGEYTYKGLYSADNAYFITLDNKDTCRYRTARGDARGEQEEEPLRVLENAALLHATAHFEENKNLKWRHFDNSGGEPTDFAFWYPVIAGTNWFTHHFTLPGFLSTDTNLAFRVKVYGRSYLPAEPDHHVTVDLNNTRVGNFTFDGRTGHLFTRDDLPGSLVRTTTNTVVIRLPGDLEKAKKVSDTKQGSRKKDKAFDVVYVDWFELEYPVRHVAVGDTFRGYTQDFSIKPFQGFLTLSGFSTPDVVLYDEGNHVRSLPGESKKSNGTYTLRFPVEMNNKTDLCGVEDSRVMHPKLVTPVRQIDLLEQCTNKDMLIVTYDDFYPELLPLKQWKDKKGVRTAIMRVTDVYDQFNFGLKNPVAIKELIDKVHHLPDSPLKYVMLAGSACEYHTSPFGEARQDLIPTHYFQSKLTKDYASDNWFVTLDNDEGIPALAIGRLPADTSEHVRHVVDKIIQYEQATKTAKNPRNKKALFIASYKSIIRFESDELVKEFRTIFPDTEILKTYADEGHIHERYDAEQIIDAINDGVDFVFFTGHGGGYIWAAVPTNFEQENMFDFEDLEKLNNEGDYFITLTATCYTAAFDLVAEKESIGMTLLHKKNAGAIAVIGTPNRSAMHFDLQFLREMLPYVRDTAYPRFGDAFVKAKTDINIREISESLTLLGDPSLDIARFKK